MSDARAGRVRFFLSILFCSMIVYHTENQNAHVSTHIVTTEENEGPPRRRGPRAVGGPRRPTIRAGPGARDLLFF